MNNTKQLLPLKDIYLPNEPSIFPLAIGWWIVIVVSIIIIALSLYFIYRYYVVRKRRNLLLSQWNAVKNDFLKHQNAHMFAIASSDFLRRIVCYQIKDEVAACLNGDAWYEYLANLLGNKSQVSLKEVISKGAFNPNITYDTSELQDFVEQIIYQVSKKMNNFSFAWWWVFALFPLVFFTRYLSSITAKKTIALYVPFLQASLAKASDQQPNKIYYYLPLWLLFLAALARPQFVGEPEPITQSGRDLIIAIDTSGSMKEQDMVFNNQRLSRIDAVKAVASDFVKRRTGDRIGLVLFGENAYLQSPLTFDHKTVNSFLNDVFLGAAGERATAIGDAIGLTVKKMNEIKEKNDKSKNIDKSSNIKSKQQSEKQDISKDNKKVLIIMTDGQNNAGVDPIKATELAKQLNLVIYTIGMGANEMIGRDVFGRQVRYNPSQDLDEKLLKQIAEQTGGRYFRAIDGESLNKIYKSLDEIEPVKSDSLVYRPITELFYLPLTAFLLLLITTLVYRQHNIKWRLN